MPWIPIPHEKVLLSWRGICFGQRIILTAWYQLDDVTPTTPGSYQEEMAELITVVEPGGGLVSNNYLACLPSSYVMTEIRAQIIFPTRYAYVAKVQSDPGTHASPATVANDSACVTMRAEKAGRNKVANRHIGPVPDAASASGLLVGGYKTLLVALGTDFLQPIVAATSGNTYYPCISHSVFLADYDPIVDFRIGDQSRVQRRRTVGLGE